MKTFIIAFKLDNGASIDDRVAIVNAFDSERAIEFLEKEVHSHYDHSIKKIINVHEITDKDYGQVTIYRL